MALLTRFTSCALLAPSLLLACSDRPLDAAVETDSSSTGVPATTSSTTGPPSTETSGGGTTTSTTDADDPVEGSTGQGSAGFITPPDGGSFPAGFCLGQRRVGYLATVHGSTEMTTCDPEPVNCGADPVGTWTVQDHCGLEDLPNFFADQCPDSTMQLLNSSVEGSRTFGEDSSYSESFTVAFESQLDLDAEACFGLGCADFGQAIDSEDGLSASCSELESGCRCILSIVDQAQRQGTYSITDAGVVIDAQNSSSDPIPFCVQGDTLTVWDPLIETRTREDVPCDVSEDCDAALEDDPEASEFDWYCAI